MNYDDEFGVLLSGGLDSSIIAKFANVFYKEKTGKVLKTFSVDYKDQEKNFIKNDFQPNTDNYYMTNHNTVASVFRQYNLLYRICIQTK